MPWPRLVLACIVNSFFTFVCVLKNSREAFHSPVWCSRTCATLDCTRHLLPHRCYPMRDFTFIFRLISNVTRLIRSDYDVNKREFRSRRDVTGGFCGRRQQWLQCWGSLFCFSCESFDEPCVASVESDATPTRCLMPGLRWWMSSATAQITRKPIRWDCGRDYLDWWHKVNLIALIAFVDGAGLELLGRPTTHHWGAHRSLPWKSSEAQRAGARRWNRGCWPVRGMREWRTVTGRKNIRWRDSFCCLP